MSARLFQFAFTTSVFLVSAAVCESTFAQLAQVQAHYVIVTEKASMRSGDGDLFYKTGELAVGTVLLRDAENNLWSRVTYPTGLGVFVRAEDVEVLGTSIKTTQPTKLKAANQATGWTGSWKAVLENPLPVGSPLKVIEGIKDGDTGPILGYRVLAPEQARGYVESRVLRKASDAELAAFKNKGTAPTPAAVVPAPAAAASVPAAKPATAAAASVTTPPPAATVASSSGSTPPVPTNQDLTIPVGAPSTPLAAPTIAPPAATGAVVAPAGVVANPVTLPPDGAAQADSGITTITQATTPEPTVDEVVETAPEENSRALNRPAEIVYDLESTFQRVWKEPVLSSEVDELLAQYNRAIDALGPESARLKQQLTRRRDALVLRVSFRETIRTQEADRARVEAGRGNVTQQLSLAEAARVYTIAGQLQASTVYDGQKLPLMFRVVSIGGGSPRTLGYLKDSPEFALIGKVGALIGVIGEAQLDRSLMLNIITPVRIDVLKPKNEVATPLAPASPPAAVAPGEAENRETASAAGSK